MDGSRRRIVFFFATLIALCPAWARADEPVFTCPAYCPEQVYGWSHRLFGDIIDTHVGKPEGEEEEKKKCYGPSMCEPRKTLMQWSYGTSFSGGAGLDDKLKSDRPDFTEASTTVGRGVVQVEMGYTYFSDTANGVVSSSHSYPEMLWRVGAFADWFEFRFAYNHGTDA